MAACLIDVGKTASTMCLNTFTFVPFLFYNIRPAKDTVTVGVHWQKDVWNTVFEVMKFDIV
jgi:hypothetical protein